MLRSGRFQVGRLLCWCSLVHHVRRCRRNSKNNPHPVFKVVVFSLSHQQSSSILSHVSAPFPFIPSLSLSSLGFLSLFSSFALKLCCRRRFVFREQRTRLWGAGRMFAVQQGQPVVFLLNILEKIQPDNSRKRGGSIKGWVGWGFHFHESVFVWLNFSFCLLRLLCDRFGPNLLLACLSCSFHV